MEVSGPDGDEVFKDVNIVGPACRRPNHSVNQALCIVMVGLPARGKTYICLKLVRYLRWIGYKTKAFNVGDYRRHVAGVQKPASFFRHDNVEAMALRKEIALKALGDLQKWFVEEDGDIAVRQVFV
jgi:6-phosphofructo-2-kinase/fructose-2,6-biphosphatase 2